MRSVIRIELVPTLRTSIKNRRSLISTPSLHFPKHHLRIMALRTLFSGSLLRRRDFLGDLKRSEVVALALKSRWVVGWSGGGSGLVRPFVWGLVSECVTENGGWAEETRWC